MVSIIVPCYNYGHLLAEALESILEQDYNDWECIVVNDGSKDSTEAIAREYCRRDNRIKYYSKENGGHSSARNFGIRLSAGDYILPLDADDRLGEGFLGSAATILEKDPGITLVTGQVQLFGDTHEKITISKFDFRSFLVVNYMPISSMFRRKDYDRTEGFDQNMLGFEDWDFFISLLKNGGGVYVLPTTSLYYRKKSGSVFDKIIKDQTLQNAEMLRLYNKHAVTYEKYFPTPILLIQENEKMQRVITAYQYSRTYKLGLTLAKLKNFFRVGRLTG